MEINELDTEIEKLWDLNNAYDEAKAKSTNAFHAAEAQEARVLAMMEAIGKEKYFHPIAGTVSVIPKTSWRTPKTNEAKLAFFDYIRQKYGDEVLTSKISVNANTLNSFCKEEFEAAIANGDASFRIPGLEEPEVYNELRITPKR